MIRARENGSLRIHGTYPHASSECRHPEQPRLEARYPGTLAVRVTLRPNGHAQVRIAGHDIGGMVTYAFVRRYPTYVRGVMILNVPLPGIEP